MKKLISMLLVLCMVLGMSVSVFADETASYAKIGSVEYATLGDAVASITTNDAVTIDVLGSHSGPGAKIKSGYNITINFNGYTYTGVGQLAGSTGTASQVFQILKNATVVMNNGTIATAASGDTLAARRMIQNYGNLTLNNMVVDGSGLSEKDGSGNYDYEKITVSFVNGTSTISGGKVIAHNDGVALSVSNLPDSNYNSVSVKVNNATIDGDIRYNTDSTTDDVTLSLSGSTLNGEITTTTSDVNLKETVTITPPANQEVVEDENGNLSIVTKNPTSEGTGTVVPDTSVEDDSWYYEEEDESYSVVVRVKFDGVDEELFDEIKVNLLRNGKKYESEELSASKISKKNWRVEFEDLDEDEEWSVALAEELEGYNAEVVNLRGNYWTITLSEVEKAPVVSTDKSNPDTGASDFVGVAMALAVVSSMGAVALSKRK